MLYKKPYLKNNKLNSTGKAVNPFIYFSRPPVLGIITFLLLSLLFSLLIYQRYQLVKENRKKEAYEIVNLAKDKLQEALLYSLSATKTLTFFIDRNGQVNNFDSIAAQILESGICIDALQLVPGGVIRYMYPGKGNEKVIGYNILEDPLRSKEAYKAIDKKEMFFAGPFELRQGGLGVVGRLPVYRNNTFWGFSAVVIKMSTLYRAAGIDTAAKNGYHFQLSKINPETKKEEFFLPQIQGYSSHQQVSLEVPNGEWKLSVNVPKANKVSADIGLLAILGLLLSVAGAVMVYRFAIQPQKLNELVKNRTLKLKASENNYRSLIERVSDAFVAINKNWEFTYVNERAAEIFAKKPQSLIGSNIWQAYPQGLDQPFYHACARAMETQEYQYLEEYYISFDKWLENHIYPSTEGLTIFFKDVTDLKRITIALKENEEKYRSLIEQASDGIVITDMEGIILEVNNSIKRMLGMEDEEMTGYHVTDFIPDEDMELLPLRISELMQGRSLLYERRIVKKDGTFVDVEINSKMASSHTLIGFIREITERKKYENKLMYQARLLESVSDAVTSLDMNRCIVSWNRACENLYGFTAEEAIGKRIPQLVAFEFSGTNTENVFKEVFSEGLWKGEFNFIHPKTKLTVHLLSTINTLKNNKGEISGFILTSKNITKRKKSEAAIKKSNERFELIAQATNDAVWDHDLQLNETWGNNELYKLYGIDPGSQKINLQMYMERIHPDDRPEIEERMELALQTGISSITEEFRFRTAGGEYRNFYDRAYIKYDIEGTPLRICGAMQDITERKITEAALVEKEKKLEQVLSSTADDFYVIDAGYKVILINKVAEKNLLAAWGKPVTSGTHILEVIPEQHDGQMKENFKRAFAGEIFEYELCNTNPALPQWIMIHFTPVIDDMSNVIAVTVVAKDITERKTAEKELLESEQKYRLLFYNNPLPMWMAAIPGLHIIDVNESAIKQYGYSRQEFLKLNAKDMDPSLEVLSFAEVKNKNKPVINNVRAWRHKRKDGKIMHLEIYSHEIMYQGRRVWLGLSQDVTEKYEAKELLQKSYEDIRQLAFNLQTIREDERTSIAREIHDELGQQLTGLKMDLHWLSRKINSTDEEINSKMKESIELINTTISSVRKISTDLRPSILDDLGLLPALEWQGQEFAKRSGTKVIFINKAGDITVKPQAATGIFRIYQELLNQYCPSCKCIGGKGRFIQG